MLRGFAGPPDAFCVHYSEQPGIPRVPPVDLLAGAVGRAVVDDHDLHPVRAQRLCARRSRGSGGRYGIALYAGMRTLTSGISGRPAGRATASGVTAAPRSGRDTGCGCRRRRRRSADDLVVVEGVVVGQQDDGVRRGELRRASGRPRASPVRHVRSRPSRVRLDGTDLARPASQQLSRRRTTAGDRACR